MAVTYVTFRGKKVSREWATILHAAEREVAFTLDSGHRSMEEQEGLYEHYLHFGHPVAARPSPIAPHIRLGRIDHAIDVNSLDGGAGRLAAWLTHRGGHPRFPVAGERWHVELPAEDVRQLAQKLGLLRGFTAYERRLIHEYDGLPRADAERRLRLRELMTTQRKRLWRLAQPIARGGDGRGWNHANRRQRYRSLLARTR